MESNTGKSKPDEYTIYAHGHGGARTIINSGSLDACIIIMTEIKSEIADSNSSGIFDVSDFKRSSNFRERLARLA